MPNVIKAKLKPRQCNALTWDIMAVPERLAGAPPYVSIQVAFCQLENYTMHTLVFFVM